MGWKSKKLWWYGGGCLRHKKFLVQVFSWPSLVWSPKDGSFPKNHPEVSQRWFWWWIPLKKNNGQTRTTSVWKVPCWACWTWRKKLHQIFECSNSFPLQKKKWRTVQTLIVYQKASERDFFHNWRVPGDCRTGVQPFGVCWNHLHIYTNQGALWKWIYPINTHYIRCIWGWLLGVPSQGTSIFS